LSKRLKINREKHDTPLKKKNFFARAEVLNSLKGTMGKRLKERAKGSFSTFKKKWGKKPKWSEPGASLHQQEKPKEHLRMPENSWHPSSGRGATVRGGRSREKKEKKGLEN